MKRGQGLSHDPVRAAERARRRAQRRASEPPRPEDAAREARRTGSTPLTTRGTPRKRWEPVKTACENCGAEILSSPSRLAKGNGRFCNRQCFAEHRKKTRVAVTCPVCGKRRYVPPSLADRLHCSRECRTIGMTHERSPVFKDGHTAGRQHFKSGQATCQHPGCPGSRHKPQEHHVVYEQTVARETTRLHDPRNALALCPGCHRRHHARVSPVPLAVLRDVNYVYAAELLGAGRAYEYLRRRYAGGDPRLDALLRAA